MTIEFSSMPHWLYAENSSYVGTFPVSSRKFFLKGNQPLSWKLWFTHFSELVVQPYTTFQILKAFISSFIPVFLSTLQIHSLWNCDLPSYCDSYTVITIDSSTFSITCWFIIVWNPPLWNSCQYRFPKCLLREFKSYIYFVHVCVWMYTYYGTYANLEEFVSFLHVGIELKSPGLVISVFTSSAIL